MIFLLLPILSKTSDLSNGKGTETLREVAFPLGSIIIDDWTESDNKTVVPNRSKVQANGAFYKVNLAKADIFKLIESKGGKILNTK